MKSPLKVIFEDEQLLILEKPPNLVVNKADTVREESLQDQLEEYFGVKESKEGLGGRAGIVHRLDKETSGLLVVAKTSDAFENLTLQFKKREVGKEYLGLVHGQIKEREFIIDAPIGRNPVNRFKFAIVAGSREAITQFRVASLYKRNSKIYTLLRLIPKTGRTHQVRVHLTAYSHPTVADELYAGRKRFREDKEWCPRLFLHASKLSFKHPRTEKIIEFNSELPEDLKTALDKCIKMSTFEGI